MISDLARQIDDLLPQTQCTKCGFSGCAPYARAIAEGSANFNQCPPGGQEGVDRLARLLSRPSIALNPENGVERPRPLAVIDESVCIGCTLCIQACPTDAIAGAAKLMHTVIVDNCTGCDLCVAPCPVDCITMVPVTGLATGWQAWSQTQADAARLRHERKLARQAAEQDAAAQRAAARVAQAQAAVQSAARTEAAATAASSDTASSSASPAAANDEQARKQAIIQAAIERARQRRLSAEADTNNSAGAKDAPPSSRPKSDHER